MSTLPSPRASLLAGLRTGGVRSSSSSFPHTAAPSGSFNISAPPFVPNSLRPSFPEESDHLGDSSTYDASNTRQIPLTAALDAPNNAFSQQQQSSDSVTPFSPSAFNLNAQAPTQAQAQVQALQLQMMQLEIMRLQAQQYQNELLAQAQRQQQLQGRRPSFNPPATAGPLSGTFDLRAATLSAQMRRAAQAEQIKSKQGWNGSEDQLPMSAAIGGRFGTRLSSVDSNGRFDAEDFDTIISNPPSTPNQTTVISGGTPLGNSHSNANSTPGSGSTTPSKSDAAVSWRRGGNNNSVLSANRAVSPSVKVTPPPGERTPSPPSSIFKGRPQPLRFNIAAPQSIAEAVIVDTDSTTADSTDDGSSSASSKSGESLSSPTTPHSSSSSDMPLSPREEASKKLYEGLGIGRPVPAPVIPLVMSHRMVSQPLRQPRGPPSGIDELGPKNFATRIRRKAIGGLGALMAGRERRELIDAF